MIASRPFISGIGKSIRVTSGRSARNSWIDSRPFEASAIMFISGLTRQGPGDAQAEQRTVVHCHLRIKAESVLMTSSRLLSLKTSQTTFHLAGQHRLIKYYESNWSQEDARGRAPSLTTSR